jgi:flagellar biogenesis protein FliO
MRPSRARASASIPFLLFVALAVAGAGVCASAQEAASGAGAKGATQASATAVGPARPEEDAAAAQAKPPAPPLGEGERLAFMAADDGGEREAPSSGGLALRALGALLLILGLIVAAGFGLRKLGASRLAGGDREAARLAVLSAVSLGDRRTLSVVRFGGRTLLVGSTPHSVNLLAAEDDEAFDDQAEAEASAPAPFAAGRSVADMLHADGRGLFGDELDAALALDRRPSFGRGREASS